MCYTFSASTFINYHKRLRLNTFILKPTYKAYKLLSILYVDVCGELYYTDTKRYIRLNFVHLCTSVIMFKVA